MKKILAFIMAFCMLLTVGAYAEIELPLSVYVDGSKVIFPDAEPFVDSNNRTLVPVRFVSEALNASVAWDGNLRQVTITKGEKVVTLIIDKKEITVNGETKTLDSAPIISESRTFVPIRFVSEALDAKVSWDGAVRTVYISTNGGSTGGFKVGDEVDIKGFNITIEEGDVANETDEFVIINKKSGISIQQDKDTDNMLNVIYKKSSKNNPEQARKDIVKILSAVFSSKTVNAVDDYLVENLNKNEYADGLLITENGLDILVTSGTYGLDLSIGESDE